MKQNNQVAGHFEPEVTHTFLPGCRNCGKPHPLARRPAIASDTCPDCGAPAGRVGPTIREDAVVTGMSPSAIVAKAAFKLGKFFNNLAKKV